MSINIPKNKESETRENRLGSITGYSGTLQELGNLSTCGGCLEQKSRCFSQASACNSSCALGQLSGINDIAIVHHAPSGCAATAMSVSNGYRLLAEALGKTRDHFAYTCTDMSESDTVFGAVDRLKEVIIETYKRYKPSAFIIAASCVSGVIGEDLEGILDDLKEEVPVPIAPVHCEGFKTQIWASGFDAAYHAILKYVVKPARKKTNRVNVVCFAGGTAWNSRSEVKRLLHALGVEPTFLLASSSVEELEHLSEAAATISTCGTLGSYMGTGLQNTYGVPYVRSLQPHGTIGFEDWVRQLAKVLNQETAANEFLAIERNLYQEKLAAVRSQLQGKRAVVAMGPGFGMNYTRVLQEFGIVVEHVSTWHFDKQYDDDKIPAAFQYELEHSPNNFTFSVNDLQNYEFMNILKRVKPDVFLSRHPGSTVWAMKLGIPAYCVYDEYTSFGYKGTLRFGQALLDLITNRSFTENLSKRVKLPYTNWWFEQKPEAFQE